MKSLPAILALLLVAVGCSSVKPPPLLNGSKGHPGDLRRVDTVHEGDRAPDFKLMTIDGRRTVRLSDFRDSKPVVLVFGSYT